MNFAERFADDRALDRNECRGVLRSEPVCSDLRVQGSVELADLFDVPGTAFPVGVVAPGAWPVVARVLSEGEDHRTAALILGDSSAAVRWEEHDSEDEELWSTFALYSAECRDDLDRVADDLVGDPPEGPEPMRRVVFDGRAAVFWLEEDAEIMGIHHGFDPEGRLVCIGIDLGVLWETRAEAGQIAVDPFGRGPVADPWLHHMGVQVRIRPTPFPGHILSVEIDEPGAVHMRFVDAAGRPLPGDLHTRETVQGWEVRLQTPILQTGPVALQLQLAPTAHPI